MRNLFSARIVFTAGIGAGLLALPFMLINETVYWWAAGIIAIPIWIALAQTTDARCRACDKRVSFQAKICPACQTPTTQADTEKN
jgi:hypothetical protein